MRWAALTLAEQLVASTAIANYRKEQMPLENYPLIEAPAAATTTLPVPASACMPAMSLDQALDRWNDIHQFISRIMVAGEDYGTVPGSKKPTLLKPGAEKLCNFFGLAPELDVVQRIENWDDSPPFFAYEIKCRLVRDSVVRGEGLGSCNSREAKYYWREAQRVCPQCGKSAIIQGKQEYGGEWVCWKKKGGCNAKFAPDDPKIVDQPSGRVVNPDLADSVNTILKMAKKRALVDAVLNTTGASQYFTQDVEDAAGTEAADPRGSEAAASEVRDRKIAELKQQQATQPVSDIQRMMAAFAAVKQELYITTGGHHDAYYRALSPYAHANELIRTSRTEQEKVYRRVCAALQKARLGEGEDDAEVQVEDEPAHEDV